MFKVEDLLQLECPYSPMIRIVFKKCGLLDLVAFHLLAFQDSHNAITCLAVAVRVHGFAHALISSEIIEEGADFVHNKVMIGSHQMDGAALKGFGALCGVAHHQDGLAKSRGFLLDAARVSEDNGGFLHQVNELQILEGFNEEEVLVCGEVFTKHFVNRLTHIGVEVHGVHEIHVGVFL